MQDKSQLDLIISLFSNGKVQEVLNQIDPLIKDNPNDAVLFNIRGACYAKIGEPIMAIKQYDQAIGIDPNYSEAYNNRAITLQELGEHEKALENFFKAFSLKPEKIEIINEVIAILQDINNPKTTIDYYLKILESSPEIFVVNFNLGIAYQELNLKDDAINSYKKTLELESEFADAYLNLGLIFENSGEHNEALINFERAIEIEPENPNFLNNLAITLKGLGQIDESIKNFEKAIEIDPDYVATYFNLGVALRELNQTERAIFNFKKAIELNSNSGESYYHLGCLYFENKKHNRAISHFDKAFSINPNIDYLIGNRLYTKMQLALWDDFEEEIDILIKKINNNENVVTPFSLMALVDNAQIQNKATQNYANSNFPKSISSKPLNPYKDHKKIRIGYFSADFHNHPTMHLMAELFEMHDKSKFEIFAFSFGPDLQDDWRRRVSISFDEFIDVRMKSDSEISAISREMEIDIAVNLGGYTQSSRTNVFAYFAAPIQVNFLGFPGTMGADYIDYIIADQTLIPTENIMYFSEKIVYMPDTYQVNMMERDISKKLLSRQELGLPKEGFIFSCFNNIHKITPPTFKSWMRILSSVEGSVLWLYANNQNIITNLLKTASNFGINSNRIIFAKHVPVDEHLYRIGKADLFLDTLPYNAHTTASEALRMGVPVITLIGNAFASRVAASLINAVDMPELITDTEDQYESLAIELALNSTKYNHIKKKLIGNLATSALFNSSNFSKYLELAFESMHQKSQLELEPEHIFVKDLLE